MEGTIRDELLTRELSTSSGSLSVLFSVSLSLPAKPSPIQSFLSTPMCSSVLSRIAFQNNALQNTSNFPCP